MFWNFNFKQEPEVVQSDSFKKKKKKNCPVVFLGLTNAVSSEDSQS